MTTSLHSQKTANSIRQKTPGRPVSEGAIAGWLGGTDFADSPSKMSKTSSTAPGQATPAKVAADDVLLRIADRLAERNILAFTRVGLNLKQGVLTVYGDVASKGERLLLIHILKSTPGILKVNDGLRVVKSRSNRIHWRNPFETLASRVTDFRTGFRPLYGAGTLFVVGLAFLFFWPKSSPRQVSVYPVKGRVVMDGVPLPNASVVLHAVGSSKLPKGLLPRGTAVDDGGVSFETFSPADGVPEGEFVATVHLLKTVIVDGDSVPGGNVLPAIYSRPETSPFRIKVSRVAKEIALLELRKPRIR